MVGIREGLVLRSSYVLVAFAAAESHLLRIIADECYAFARVAWCAAEVAGLDPINCVHSVSSLPKQRDGEESKQYMLKSYLMVLDRSQTKLNSRGVDLNK